MDCVFIDEDQEEDELLPEFFDPEVIQMLKSDVCQLCSTKFAMFGSASQHNCKKCGKSICDSCSKSKRRLSKLEKTKFRVCDECDCLLSNTIFRGCT